MELTHPDRILFQAQGLTKRDLAEYYLRVSDWMLPHVRDRILTVVRCPEGTPGPCFFQKHATPGLPDSIHTVRIHEKEKAADYMTIRDTDGLVALVQIGALEIHAWNARRDRVERPDQLVFDLDPGRGVPFNAVARAARTVRDRLFALGLQTFAKATGGKGLHVVAPVVRRVDWNGTQSFCKAVAEGLARDAPASFVTTMSKEDRVGRIFIDHFRNARGATSICPFSTRARPGAPVSAPLAWDELSGDRAGAFDVASMTRRLAALERDPWEGFFELRQSVTRSMRREVGAHFDS